MVRANTVTCLQLQYHTEKNVHVYGTIGSGKHTTKLEGNTLFKLRLLSMAVDLLKELIKDLK